MEDKVQSDTFEDIGAHMLEGLDIGSYKWVLGRYISSEVKRIIRTEMWNRMDMSKSRKGRAGKVRV
jgi:hypothetical protein